MAKFCPYCGKEMSDRSKFCPKCGKPAPRRADSTVAVEVPESVGDNAPRHTSVRTALHDAATAPEHSQPKPTANLNGVTPKAVPAPTVLRGYTPRTQARVGPSEQAGFGLRYGAWMFDFLITLIAMMSFTFILTALSRRSVVGSNRDLLLVAGLTLLLFLLNFVVLAGRGGQSAGMRILGIRIERIDGRPFTMRRAALRHLAGYPLSTAAFFLGFLWMLWDPRQQGWHDKLARTIVVVSR